MTYSEDARQEEKEIQSSKEGRNPTSSCVHIPLDSKVGTVYLIFWNLKRRRRLILTYFLVWESHC